MWPYLLLCVSRLLPLNFGDSWPFPPLAHTSCLPNIPTHLCPLCRTPFTSVVKLHLDVDDAPKGYPMTPSLNITQSEQEARRLLGLFDKALDHGCSEVELKGLLEGCKAFLSSQPRSVVGVYLNPFSQIPCLSCFNSSPSCGPSTD